MLYQFLKWFTISIFAFIALFVGFFYWLTWEPSHPSDAEMIQNFEKNQSRFEELVQMIRTDHQLQRVDDDWTRPADPSTLGISKERIALYRKIFNELKIPRGFEVYSQDIHFIANTRGLSISGSAKGYYYSSIKPDLLVEDSDEYRSPDGQSYTAYRHLSGNWYLYYDFED